MALRIKTNDPAPIAEPEVPEAPIESIEPIEEPTIPDDGMLPMAGGGTVDPLVARYLGPMERCESCIHFLSPGSCEIVAGPIDPQGVCSLHTADAEAGMEEPIAPEGAPLTEIPPTEY